LIEKSGAKVVISSAWRYMIHEGVMTIKGFSHMLLSHGIHCEIEGITVSDETLKGRGDQISQWLSVNKKLGIESYVVLDDMDLGISGKHPFVKTNPRIGLTMDDVKKALDILAVEQELNTSHEEINWSKGSKLILP
jgi:hypothetical protein